MPVVTRANMSLPGMSFKGLRLKENLSPSDIEALYFQGHPGNYHAQEHVHFACAVVE